jgi:hypothetical protein
MNLSAVVDRIHGFADWAVPVVKDWFHSFVDTLTVFSERVHPVVDAVSLVGTFAALVAILVAWRQLGDSNRYAVAQNWITIRAILTEYDDIHANLRPGGNWHASKEKPDTIADWARTELYMGTYELMEVLMSKKLLEYEQIAKFYKYRVGNIIANPKIVKYKLIDNADRWPDFRNLCDRLELRLPKEEWELEALKEGLSDFTPPTM